MALGVGMITKGEVTGIKNFGAFIKLEDGRTGLCHISEVSSDYVKDIKKYLKVGEEVKVKIIKSHDGKLSLSIKECEIKKTVIKTDDSEELFKKKEPRSKNFENMLSNFMDNSSENQKSNYKKKSRRGNGYGRD